MSTLILCWLGALCSALPIQLYLAAVYYAPLGNSWPLTLSGLLNFSLAIDKMGFYSYF